VVVAAAAVTAASGLVRPFRRINGEVLALNESVFLDSAFDPVREVAANLQRLVQIAGIAKLGGLVLKLAGEDRLQGGWLSWCLPH